MSAGSIGSWSFIAYPLLWSLGGALLFWTVLLLPYRVATRTAWEFAAVYEEVMFCFFACLLGLVVGVVTGLSRAPAVGAVVPAVLPLIGALVGYLYAVPSARLALRPTARVAVIASATALGLFFFVGAFLGAEQRGSWDAHAQASELYRLQYAAELERGRMRYADDLERTRLQYQAELEVWKARQVQPRAK